MQKDINISEDYQSNNELDILVYKILKQVAKKNFSSLSEKNGDFFIYGLHLRDVETSPGEFEKIEEFVSNANVYIHFVEKGYGKTYGIYQTYDDNAYNKHLKRSIELYYNSNNLKESVDMRKKDNRFNVETFFDILDRFFYNSLIHEIQHAYDDYRSNSKIYQGKKEKEHAKKFMQTADSDDFYHDQENYKEYLNLKPEIWARFAQALKKVRFTFFDFEENEKGGMREVYKMNNLKSTISDFKIHFSGYLYLPEKMRKKLLSRVVQYWHKKQEEVKEFNRISQFQYFKKKEPALAEYYIRRKIREQINSIFVQNNI